MPKQILNNFTPEVTDAEIRRLAKKKDVGIVAGLARDCLFYQTFFNLCEGMFEVNNLVYTGQDRRKNDRRLCEAQAN